MNSIYNSFRFKGFDIELPFLVHLIAKEKKKYLSNNSIGSYYPNLLVTNYENNPFRPITLRKNGNMSILEFSIDMLLSSWKNKLNQISDTEDRVEFLLNETVYIHEEKHFHDQLCTPHGFNRFSNWFKSSFDILSILVDNRREGNFLSKPVMKYIYDNDPNERVKLAAKIYSNLELIEAFDDGGLNVAEIKLDNKEYDFPPDIVIVKVILTEQENDSIYLPAFLLRTIQVEKERQEKVGRLVTLGFKNLTESSASNVQQDIFGFIDPELKTVFRKRLKDFTLQGALKYEIIDLLFTRLVKRRGGKNYDANSLHRLIFGSLFSEHQNNDALSENKSIENSNQIIWKFLRGVANRYHPKIDYVEDITNSYLDSINNWEQLAKETKEYLYKSVVNPKVDVWCKMFDFIEAQITTPSIEFYKRQVERQLSNISKILDIQVYNQASIDSLGKYWLSDIHHLPRVPISFTSEEIFFSTKTERELFNYTALWLKWSLCVSAIEQVIYREKLVCPWRKSFYSDRKLSNRVMSLKNFFPTEQCRSDIGCEQLTIQIGKELKCEPRCPWEEINCLIGTIKYFGKIERKSWFSDWWDKISGT